MALVTGVVYPNDGDRIKAINYNDPIQKIIAQLNGNLDDSNIASLSGTKITAGSIPNTAFANSAAAGWFPLSVTPTVATGYNKGNKEFDLTFASTDLSSVLAPGMRFKVSRSTAPPTQCADLEASSSQFASKSSPTGISFTDDFTLEAWIKPESYGLGNIASRYDGTTGFSLQLSGNGQLSVLGIGTAGAVDIATTYQSVPLNTWVHVAATLDMSGAVATTYINGAAVPNAYTNGAASALVQAGNLQIGAANNTGFFDGKIADVRVWNVVRTATQIRDNMNQQLVGNESNLVGYFKLNGDLNDSTANANNMTGSGGAVATNVDNPMKSVEYALIHKVNYSAPNTTVTVFTGTDYNIPLGTLSSPNYSAVKNPLGFSSARNKWTVETIVKTDIGQSAPASGSYYLGFAQISIPTGEWTTRYMVNCYILRGAAGTVDGHITLSGNSSSDDSPEFHSRHYGVSVSELLQSVTRQRYHSLTSQTTHYLISKIVGAGYTSVNFLGGDGPTIISAESAYI